MRRPGGAAFALLTLSAVAVTSMIVFAPFLADYDGGGGLLAIRFDDGENIHLLTKYIHVIVHLTCSVSVSRAATFADSLLDPDDSVEPREKG